MRRKDITETEKRVEHIFRSRNIADMARETGYPRTTLNSWKNHPEIIKAVDLERLEEMYG